MREQTTIETNEKAAHLSFERIREVSKKNTWSGRAEDELKTDLLHFFSVLSVTLRQDFVHFARNVCGVKVGLINSKENEQTR